MNLMEHDFLLAKGSLPNAMQVVNRSPRKHKLLEPAVRLAIFVTEMDKFTSTVEDTLIVFQQSLFSSANHLWCYIYYRGARTKFHGFHLP